MKLVSRLDALVKEGRFDVVRRELHGLRGREIPRAERAPLAAICRRAGLAYQGVLLLNRLVRGTPKAPPTATETERVEYAACLTLVGAGEEAEALLERIDPAKLPQAYLVRTFALVSRWDYGPTIPLLEAYLKHPSPGPYDKLVAKTNLGAALVATARYEEAEPLLTEMAAEARQGDHRLLLGSIIQLRAQNAIFLERWSRAGERLDEAEGLFRHTGGIQMLFVRKWRCFLEMLRAGAAAPFRKELAGIRREAVALEHFETLRECDRYEGRVDGNRALLFRLYFGTESRAYRARILEEFGSAPRLPDSYLWRLGNGGTLDVARALWKGRPAGLKEGQVEHRVLLALSADFYRPFRLTELHYRIYPRDYFNPVSSPKRVHRALGRFRQWAKRRRVPITVEVVAGRYRLGGALSLRVEPESNRSRPGLLLERLRGHFGDREFRTPEAVRALGSSPSAVHRLLRHGKAEGILTTVGAGPRTRYRISPKM